MEISVINNVLEFATQAHGSQMRKYVNEPYITHPVAVAELVKDRGGDINMQCAALLHDVLEDTAVTHAQLRAFLHRVFDIRRAEDVLQLVVELTDVYTKENFPELNRHARKTLEAKRLSQASDRAKAIKIADIDHNSESITKHDPKFAKVFLQEKEMLLDNLFL